MDFHGDWIGFEIIKLCIPTRTAKAAGSMDLEEAILTRRSVRAYSAKDVPEDLVNHLLELASWAPSAGNLQSRDFVVIRNQQTKDDMVVAALGQDFIAQAPVVVVAVANLERVAQYGTRGRDLYAIQDAAAAVQNLLLAAHAKGLGTVWVGAFEERGVRTAFGLPSHARPVAIIPIGYPAETPSAREHLGQGEYIHFEEW